MFLHTDSGSKEEWTTAEFINSHRAANSDEKLEHVLSCIESSLLGLVLNTSTLIDDVGIVADESISGVLRDNTQGDQKHETVTVTAGSKEIKIAAALLGLVLEGDCVLDLSVLKLHGRVVGVAVGVILGKDVKGFLVALVGHEPTGGLGDPPDEGDLDQGWHGLDEGDGSP